jgi:small subunit ribosomal protein S3
MGQKIHPTGFRLAVNKNWASRWYANSKNFGPMLAEDIKVRDFLKRFAARAKGRGNRVLKHTCHIFITVGD